MAFDMTPRVTGMSYNAAPKKAAGIGPAKPSNKARDSVAMERPDIDPSPNAKRRIQPPGTLSSNQPGMVDPSVLLGRDLSRRSLMPSSGGSELPSTAASRASLMTPIGEDEVTGFSGEALQTLIFEFVKFLRDKQADAGKEEEQMDAAKNAAKAAKAVALVSKNQQGLDGNYFGELIKSMAQFPPHDIMSDAQLAMYTAKLEEELGKGKDTEMSFEKLQKSLEEIRQEQLELEDCWQRVDELLNQWEEKQMRGKPPG